MRWAEGCDLQIEQSDFGYDTINRDTSDGNSTDGNSELIDYYRVQWSKNKNVRPNNSLAE